MIRLNQPLNPEQVETLVSEFSEIIEPGSTLQLSGPFPEEQDQPDLSYNFV